MHVTCMVLAHPASSMHAPYIKLAFMHEMCWDMHVSGAPFSVGGRSFMPSTQVCCDYKLCPDHTHPLCLTGGGGDPWLSSHGSLMMMLQQQYLIEFFRDPIFVFILKNPERRRVQQQVWYVPPWLAPVQGSFHDWSVSAWSVYGIDSTSIRSVYNFGVDLCGCHRSK